MTSREATAKDDNFYKSVLNRSRTRFLEDLDTSSILDLFYEREFLPYHQIRDIQDLSPTSEKIREILKTVSSKGHGGYQVFKQLLRESKQEHLAEYLDRQEADLEKKLMAEKKNESKGKHVKLQIPVAVKKAEKGEERIPNDKELIKISSHIGKNWMMLGPFLGVPTATVDQVDMDNSTTRMKIYRLLYVWRGIKGSDATLRNLLIDLRNAPDAVNIDWHGLKETINNFGYSAREVDEGRERETYKTPAGDVQQTFEEQQTEMLMKKLNIGHSSVEQDFKQKGVPEKHTAVNYPNQDQPYSMYHPSFEATKGELGKTRRAGELYSNEYGPDLSGKSFPKEERLLDPDIYVGDKKLTSGKGVLDSSYKSFQQIPNVQAQIYQVQHGEVKKNYRGGEECQDSADVSSSERESTQSGLYQPSPIHTGSGGSFAIVEPKENERDTKDEDNREAIHTDVVDASRDLSVERQMTNNLGQEQVTFTPCATRGAIFLPAVEPNEEIAPNLRQQQTTATQGAVGGDSSLPHVEKEDHEAMFSIDNIKRELGKLENRIKRGKGADDIDATALPNQNVVDIISREHSRPVASSKPDAKNDHGISEARSERVRRIFECEQELKGRLKVLTEENVQDLLAVSEYKPGLDGGYGEIYLSKKIIPGINKRLVLKKITCKGQDGDDKVQKIKSLTSEKLCARTMHFGIVPLFGIHEDSLHKEYYFLSPFMENGDLYHAIEKDNNLIATRQSPVLTVFHRLRIMYQIASAIDFLHTPIPLIRGMILHRDVKSLNIVLDEFLNARIIDFGLARELKFGYKHTNTTHYSCTPGYGKLTQQLKIERHDDYRYFGVVIRELLTGKKPSVEGKKNDGLIQQTKDKIKRLLMKMWAELEVVPPVTEPLVELSSECIKNKEISSDKIVSELKEHLRHSGTKRWNCGKNQKSGIVLHNPKKEEKKVETALYKQKGTKVENVYSESGRNLQRRVIQTEMCDICLSYDAVKEIVLQHEDCDNHIHVCVSCMRNSYCNPIHCHSCDTKVTPTIGHHWAALLIAGYDEREWVAKSFKEDVNAIKQVITSKCPLVMGVSTTNVQTVCPGEKQRPDDMKDRLNKAVEALKSIKGIQTLLVYYSGHYNREDGGFKLVHCKEGDNGIRNEEQYISVEEFQSIISEILYGCEPSKTSKRTIVFLDCCSGPAVMPTIEHQKLPGASGDAIQGTNLPCLRLSENVRIVQINTCRPDESSVLQPEGSPFRRYIVQCFTKEARGAKCLNGNCDQCKIEDDFITSASLLKYLDHHLRNHQKMENYDPVLNSYNASNLDLKIGYVVNFKVDLRFSLKSDHKTIPITIPQSMYTELRELQVLLFEKYVEKMELDKFIGIEPELDRTEFHEMICIEVEKPKANQNDKVTSLDQLMTAWNAKRELLVTLREFDEIYMGMVGIFLPSDQSVQPILEYLNTSPFVKLEKKDYITVAKIDMEENFQKLYGNLRDVHKTETSLDTFYDHFVDIENALLNDEEEMKRVKELHIVFPCKTDENGSKVHRKNFICYQLKREEDLI